MEEKLKLYQSVTNVRKYMCKELKHLNITLLLNKNLCTHASTRCPIIILTGYSKKTEA